MKVEFNVPWYVMLPLVIAAMLVVGVFFPWWVILAASIGSVIFAINQGNRNSRDYDAFTGLFYLTIAVVCNLLTWIIFLVVARLEVAPYVIPIKQFFGIARP